MHILVTGGAGYIGSHTLIELYHAGHTAEVADNLANSSVEAVRRVEKMLDVSIPFHQLDVCNAQALDQLFSHQPFDAIIHFAGLKSVGESVQNPLRYYSTNITSSLNLLSVIKKYHIPHLIFSSSATVYGTPESLPLTENSRTGIGITNPYGHTKYMIEQIMRDFAQSNPTVAITLLRYFNPIGAHESGAIGEDPHDVPNNLLPYIAQVAVGKRPEVQVFGDDYPTPDGTGVRDYIHVVDLARGHVAALAPAQPGVHTYNLGTGKGTSVLELISAFSAACKKELPYRIVARRPGDIAECYADSQKAAQELNWHPTKSIADACRDSWRWQSQNPNGYR
ncbi:UDP-glucose 4-epimerase GalE [Candidatus Saccharibacteria bacterium]|nr:UDP-glucose 4-epimerase GalE [Candidatus Saccharibacteria bacterium]